MRTDVSLATAEDFRAFHGKRPEPKLWLAKIGRQNGVPVGMGGVVWDDWGRAIGFLDLRGKPPAFTLHREAVAFLKALKDAGEPCVYIAPENDDAYRWLYRLGFEHAEPAPLMKLDLQHGRI